MMRGGLMCALVLAACGDPPPAPPVTPQWAQALDAPEQAWLLSVWGTGRDHRFAVGGVVGGPGLILERDAERWKRRVPSFPIPLLNWVHGFGTDDVWIVGEQGMIIHYDGATFTEVPTPTGQTLWGVWGADPGDLWAVGGDGRMAGQATLLRNNGAGWQVALFPPLVRPNVFGFFKVWGTATDDVYVVGQRGALMHFDGMSWAEIDIGVSDDLISLWGTGPDRIAVVGGRATGVVGTYDGVSWESASVAPVPALNGVWMREPGTAHLAGADRALAALDFDTLAVEIEQVGQDGTVYHAVHGTGDGLLTAVGGNMEAILPPFFSALVERPLNTGE